MFLDRHMAGTFLAKKLTDFASDDTIIYALPTGGVPVAYEIAKALRAPLDFLIVQKIGHPASPNFGICAVSEAGNITCDECGMYGLSWSWISDQVVLKDEEAIRRRQVYAHGKPSASARNKIAIIVDDGIATGITMKAAITALSHQGPKKIIIATPVIPHELMSEFKILTDGVVTLIDDHNYLGVVDAYYTDFSKVTDQEVIIMLEKAKRNLTGNHAKVIRTNEYSTS